MKKPSAVVSVRRKIRVHVILAMITMAMVACVKPKPQQPVPTPTPGATMPVLRIEGSRFVPGIWGAAAGSGSVPYGWPFASIALLDALKSNGLNYSHIRGGTYVEDSPEFIIFAKAPDGRYNLDAFSPAYEKALRDFLRNALDRGIYVEKVVAGGDDWPGKVNKTPFNGPYNINGINYFVGEGGDKQSYFSRPTPPAEVERAIRHDVAISCEFPNVFYATDNEPRSARTSAEWTRSVYRIIKEELALRGCTNRPVGSGNSDAWDTADYQINHTFRVPAPSLKPMLVNETDNRETTPEQYVKRAQRGADVGGVYFMFWPGPMEESADQVTATLVKYGLFVGGVRWDYGCPAFTGWKLNIQAVQGNKYTLNSSPKPFSEGADQFSSLGDGLCEDIWVNSPTPQRYQDGYGPAWSIEGGGTVEPNWSNPYLAFVWDPVAGSTVVKACSRADTNCGVFAF